MTTSNSYIFGNRALHARFCLITEILGKFVASAPRAVSIDQLQAVTGQAIADLSRLCDSLGRNQLLRPAVNRPGAWELACEPSLVTLEDVYRCALSERRPRPAKSARGKPGTTVAGDAGSLPHDVDLLIMQATMAIDQSVFRHLRQFSLDRLKIAAAALPAGVEATRRLCHVGKPSTGAF